MLTRIITGVIGIAIAALIIQTGGLAFEIAAFVLAMLAWREYDKAFSQQGEHLTSWLGLLGIINLLLSARHEGLGMTAFIAFFVLAICLQTVFFHGKVTFRGAALSVLGMLYIGLPFAHLILLRNFGQDMPQLVTSLGSFEPGCALVWVMFIGTWASDSFAYFVGSALGRHKLCPSISPNKTIEGAVGAVVGTTLTIAALGAFFGWPLPLMAVLGALIAVFATVGDLVESVAKRETGIKDSGNIIPGHGGVWDRFDSVLFTAPLVYYFTMAYYLLTH